MDTYKARNLLLPSALAQIDIQPFAPVIANVRTMARETFLAMMNGLASCLAPDEIYLEVGTFLGGSLIGALLGNEARAVAVDNFSEFQLIGGEEELQKNIKMFGMQDRIKFHNEDFHAYFSREVSTKVGLYYYDGAHDAINTRDGLELGLPHVVTDGLIVLDDTIYPQVVQAINAFLGEHPAEIKILFAASPLVEFDPIFWNGTIVLQKVAG